MATKYDRIIEKLSSIDVNVASIEGHLKQLNDKVSRNVTDIRDNKKTLIEHHKNVDKIDKQLAKWMGGIGVLILAITFLINYLM